MEEVSVNLSHLSMFFVCLSSVFVVLFFDLSKKKFETLVSA